MLSLCLLNTILVVVGVSLQLMGLCSRAGLYGPGTAFLLHPLHCTLCLCRWQTLTAGFVWAGGSQRCLRCLNSSFSRQLSMPGTLFTSLVANTLNCSPRGWEGKAQWVKSDPPPTLAQVWEDRKFPELFRAGEWAVAGKSMKVFGLSVPHRALTAVRRASATGNSAGKRSLHLPVRRDQPSRLACFRKTWGWPLHLQLMQYLCSWSGKRHGFYSLLGGWVSLSPSAVPARSLQRALWLPKERLWSIISTALCILSRLQRAHTQISAGLGTHRLAMLRLDKTSGGKEIQALAVTVQWACLTTKEGGIHG